MTVLVEMTFTVPDGGDKEQSHHVTIDADSIVIIDPSTLAEGKEPPKVSEQRELAFFASPWHLTLCINCRLDHSCLYTHTLHIQPPAGSIVYSGRHDQGVLLPRRGVTSPMARLVAAVQQAKQASNEYLTAVMDREKTSTAASPSTAEPSTKRTKVDDNGETEA